MRYSTTLFTIAASMALLLIVGAVRGADDTYLAAFLLLVAIYCFISAIVARNDGQ